VKVRIEAVHPEKIDEIVAIENDCMPVPWLRQDLLECALAKDKLYLCAIVDNRVVGYAGLWQTLLEGHITNIAVLPPFQRKGIGSLLLSRLIDAGISRGITKFILEVRESNHAAISLYERFGFQVTGIIKGYYYDNGEDALTMALQKSK